MGLGISDFILEPVDRLYWSARLCIKNKMMMQKYHKATKLVITKVKLLDNSTVFIMECLPVLKAQMHQARYRDALPQGALKVAVV